MFTLSEEKIREIVRDEFKRQLDNSALLEIAFLLTNMDSTLSDIKWDLRKLKDYRRTQIRSG